MRDVIGARGRRNVGVGRGGTTVLRGALLVGALALLAACSSEADDAVRSSVPSSTTSTSSTTSSTSSTTTTSTTTTTVAASTTTAAPATTPAPTAAPPGPPTPVAPPAPPPPVAPAGSVSGWETVSTVRGRAVGWRATASVNGVAVTLLRMDPALHLWLFEGGRIPSQYVANTAIAFNSAFQYGGESGIQTASTRAGAINPGMAAAVGYVDNTTEVGQWGRDVPNPGKGVAWVRTNLSLLVDGGQLSPGIGNVGQWGAPLNGYVTARSALGITGDGSLIYASTSAGNPDVLGVAMQRVGTQRAMTLDMNPWWVLSYAFNNGQPWIMSYNGNHLDPYLFVNGWQRDIFVATLD